LYYVAGLPKLNYYYLFFFEGGGAVLFGNTGKMKKEKQVTKYQEQFLNIVSLFRMRIMNMHKKKSMLL